MPETKQHAIIRRAVLSWVARYKQEDLYFYLTEDDPKIKNLIEDLDFDLTLMSDPSHKS